MTYEEGLNQTFLNKKITKNTADIAVRKLVNVMSASVWSRLPKALHFEQGEPWPSAIFRSKSDKW